MKLKKFCLLARLAIAMSFPLWGTTFEFVEKKDQVETDFTWTEKQEENQIVLQGNKPEGKTTIICDPHYFFNSMDFQSDKEHFAIKKKNGSLYIERTLNQHTVRKKINIGNEPWVQQFWFGLRPLLRSKRDKLRFSIIDPKGCKRYRMIATKQKVEALQIFDKTYQALHVKITLQGLKSMFWSGHIWFDVETEACLKYEADEGPNTPLTTVLLKKISRPS